MAICGADERRRVRRRLTQKTQPSESQKNFLAELQLLASSLPSTLVLPLPRFLYRQAGDFKAGQLLNEIGGFSYDILGKMVNAMSQKTKESLASNLQILLYLNNEPGVTGQQKTVHIAYGTGCSGSELVSIWLGHLGKFLEGIITENEEGEEHVNFHHCWSAECVNWKRKWILNNFPGAPVFMDVGALAQGAGAAETEPNCYTKSLKVAPVHFFVMGFSCRDASRLSTNHAARLGCVEGKEGSTGTTAQALLDFLRCQKPYLFIAENVTSLDDKDVAGGSNLQTLLRKFQEVGYHTIVLTLSNEEFGLPQRRKRLFMCGFRRSVRWFREGNYAFDAFEYHFHDIVAKFRLLDKEAYPLKDFILDLTELRTNWLCQLDEQAHKRSQDPSLLSMPGLGSEKNEEELTAIIPAKAHKWMHDHVVKWMELPNAAVMNGHAWYDILSQNTFFLALPHRMQDILIIKLASEFHPDELPERDIHTAEIVVGPLDQSLGRCLSQPELPEYHDSSIGLNVAKVSTRSRPCDLITLFRRNISANRLEQ